MKGDIKGMNDPDLNLRSNAKQRQQRLSRSGTTLPLKRRALRLQRIDRRRMLVLCQPYSVASTLWIFDHMIHYLKPIRCKERPVLPRSQARVVQRFAFKRTNCVAVLRTSREQQ